MKIFTATIVCCLFAFAPDPVIAESYFKDCYFEITGSEGDPIQRLLTFSETRRAIDSCVSERLQRDLRTTNDLRYFQSKSNDLSYRETQLTQNVGEPEIIYQRNPTDVESINVRPLTILRGSIAPDQDFDVDTLKGFTSLDGTPKK